MNQLTQSSNPQDSQHTQCRARRASIASTSLFAIGNNIREAGFDHFLKIPRSNQVQTSAISSAQPGQHSFAINEGASTSGTSGVNVDNFNNASHAFDEYDEYDKVEYLQYSTGSEVDQTEILISTIEEESENEFGIDVLFEEPSPLVATDATNDDDFGIANLFEEIAINNGEKDDDDDFGIANLFEEAAMNNSEMIDAQSIDEFSSSDFYEEVVSTTDEGKLIFYIKIKKSNTIRPFFHCSQWSWTCIYINCCNRNYCKGWHCFNIS